MAPPTNRRRRSAFGARATGERLERMRRSPQWRGRSFDNDLPERFEPWRALTGWVTGDAPREPRAPLPILERRGEELEAPPPSGLRLTWLGHSTVLVDIDGMRIVTDPVWGERSSPSRLGGPKRFFAPPLPLGELPALDAVVISHDHYDHLCAGTIAAMASLDVPFVVPLGVGAHLEGWGIAPSRITELDWWESHRIGDLELTCTPARHFSGRGAFDRKKTLWCSWVMRGPRHGTFFSGDTAMFPGFAEIGRRLGPFDASLMEIGAYNRAWADVHIGPEQALAAHRQLRGGLFVPVHWGTFNLAMHGWTEPVERLLVAAAERGTTVAVPRPGQSVEPASPPPLDRWWPDLPWQTADEHPIVSSGLERAPSPTEPIEAPLQR